MPRVTNGSDMGKRTIWKFPLEVMDEQTVPMPDGAKVLSVGLDADGALCVWAVVDPDRPRVGKSFRIYGTGNPVPADLSEVGFLGTVLMPPFVWHVYGVR